MCASLSVKVNLLLFVHALFHTLNTFISLVAVQRLRRRQLRPRAKLQSWRIDDQILNLNKIRTLIVQILQMLCLATHLHPRRGRW